MKKKGFTLIDIIVVIAMITVLGIILSPALLKVLNERTVTTTVTDKGIKRSTGENASDKYLIYTDDGTYEITDSLLKWRWNSSDLYGAIEIGETYELTVAGFRIPLLSFYPNVYEARKIEE